MNHNLFESFAKRMTERRQHDFIVTPEGRNYNYGEALEVTEQLAGALVELGVEPGDRVAVQVDKSPEAILLYLACLRMGGVYLPLNTGYTAAEIGYFLGNAEPHLFVCQPAALEAARKVAQETGCPHVETLADDGTGSLMTRAATAERYTAIEPRGA
ncbi:MAG: AMP-binding protein, partial [Marinobacter sp.]|uniref:AMP-binding protein n=1 Tax=Marinobacter sp. TaxID=50741 RepID=UPI00299D2F2E